MNKKLWTFVSAVSVYAGAFSASSMEDIKVEADKSTETNIIASKLAAKKDYIFGKSVTNETNSLKKIKQSIGEVNEKILVICDIDKTIVRQTNVSLAYEYDKEWNYIQDRFEKKYPSYEKDYDYYAELAYKTAEELLLDNGWVDFIKYIKEKGEKEKRVKIIAITAIENKKMYNEMLIDMRREKLMKLGIDFSGSFDFPPKWFGKEEQSPYYDRGILTSLPKSKSEALASFLKYAKYVPDKIVCIDDQIINLIDLNEFCLHTGIKFMGYEYTKAKEFPYTFPFSYERAFFQLKYLVKNKRFLTDAEAEEEMNQRNDEIQNDPEEYLRKLSDEENQPPKEDNANTIEDKQDAKTESVNEEKGAE